MFKVVCCCFVAWNSNRNYIERVTRSASTSLSVMEFNSFTNNIMNLCKDDDCLPWIFYSYGNWETDFVRYRKTRKNDSRHTFFSSRIHLTHFFFPFVLIFTLFTLDKESTQKNKVSLILFLILSHSIYNFSHFQNGTATIISTLSL